MSPRFFSPAETARRLKVSTKALRLYETLGLVKPVRTSTGWRTYGPDQMVRLHQVLALKHLGLPLRRVGELLGDQLADLDAVLLLQEQALRARIADDASRLELLVAVRRRLAGGYFEPPGRALVCMVTHARVCARSATVFCRVVI